MMIFLLSGLCFLLIALSFALYPLHKNRRLCMGIFFLFTLSAGVGYWHWGAWDAWQSHMEMERNRVLVKALMQSPDGPEQLIQKLKMQLAKTPDSTRGWYLLGRLYASREAWPAAEKAFARAYALEMQDEAIAVNYAQSLWQNNQQHFNRTIRGILQKLLEKNPEQPDALAMLAMDFFTEKNYPMAVDYWERLLKLTPPQSEEAMALRKAIAKAIGKR